jgi:hypothetical protein
MNATPDHALPPATPPAPAPAAQLLESLRADRRAVGGCLRSRPTRHAPSRTPGTPTASAPCTTSCAPGRPAWPPRRPSTRSSPRGTTTPTASPWRTCCRRVSSLWPARLSPQATNTLTDLPPHAVEMLRDVLDIAGRDPWTWPPMDAGDLEGGRPRGRRRPADRRVLDQPRPRAPVRGPCRLARLTVWSPPERQEGVLLVLRSFGTLTAARAAEFLSACQCGALRFPPCSAARSSVVRSRRILSGPWTNP